MSRTLAGKYRPKIGAGHILAFSLAGTLVTGAFLAAALVPHNGTDTMPFTQYHECQTEDSAGPCYWDATTQGNGQGRSFTVDADGNVTYLPTPVPLPCDNLGCGSAVRPLDKGEIGTAVSLPARKGGRH